MNVYGTLAKAEGKVRDHVLFVEWAGAAIVSRGGRLYVRAHGELAEIGSGVRTIVASGFGFVVTLDAIDVCVRRHVEIIATGSAQSWTAIYAPYPQANASRAGLAIRARQFAAVIAGDLSQQRDRDDHGRGLRIAKDIVRRKIIAEGHDKAVRDGFLSDLAESKTVAKVRHVEAKTAQLWWNRWRDFKLEFVKGYRPPERWRFFKTRYIGRAQGKSGELAKQFTPRFAETPLQAMHNFAVAIVVARLTRVICARGLDPCFGFLHDGKKPGRYSLAWDAVEVLRPGIAEAVFDYARGRVFKRADFAQQDGVVRI